MKNLPILKDRLFLEASVHSQSCVWQLLATLYSPIGPLEKAITLGASLATKENKKEKNTDSSLSLSPQAYAYAHATTQTQTPPITSPSPSLVRPVLEATCTATSYDFKYKKPIQKIEKPSKNLSKTPSILPTTTRKAPAAPTLSYAPLVTAVITPLASSSPRESMKASGDILVSKGNCSTTSCPDTVSSGRNESPRRDDLIELLLAKNERELAEISRAKITREENLKRSPTTLSPLSPLYTPSPPSTTTTSPSSKHTYASILKDPATTTTSLPFSSFSTIKNQPKTLTIRDLEKKFKTQKLNLFISSLLSSYSEVLSLF